MSVPMRAALSLLALVIVAAIVLSLARQQAKGLQPTGQAGASAPAVGAALPQPQAVGRQVQSQIDEASRRTAEAASAAAN